MTAITDIVPIFGFQITKIEVTAGKKEEDVGNLKITLQAAKEELRAQDYDIGEMLGALNMHSSTKEPIAVQLRF